MLTGETGGKGETRGFEVRSFLNFEPRPSNFGSRLVRRQVISSTADTRFTFHTSRFTVPVQHPATHPVADTVA